MTMAGGLLCCLVSSCLTPMSSLEVDTLTTCRNTSLDQIRSNLLLGGYEIVSFDDKHLMTGYKQISSWGNDRHFRRIAVVKLDKSTFRFQVRNRDITMQTIKESSLTLGSANAVEGNKSATTIELNRTVERQNDSDRQYYTESRSDYLATQLEVCGRQPSEQVQPEHDEGSSLSPGSPKGKGEPRR
jgi:hypothetical protein